MTKILLVEDNELNRDMLSRRLARRRWRLPGLGMGGGVGHGAGARGSLVHG